MTSEVTSWTVIRRAADGSAADRDEFVRRYGPVIRSYLRARWRQTPMMRDVADAAQQVFVDCFRENGALGRADPDQGGFRAFLYGVVRNVARAMERAQARRRDRREEGDCALEAVASEESSLAQVFDRAWGRALLRQAVALQRRRAEAAGDDAIRRHRLLTLRYGENLPIREIATRWDMDAAILHREATKARAEFKQALMAVVRDLQGGGPQAVEEESARLLALFS